MTSQDKTPPPLDPFAVLKEADALDEQMADLWRETDAASGMQMAEVARALEQGIERERIARIEEEERARLRVREEWERERQTADAPAPDRPASSASTRSRSDAIQIEIDDATAALKGEGKRVTAAMVMPILKARAGRADSCISEIAPDGLIWTRDTTGRPEKLTMEALKKRISRDAKGTRRTPTGS